MGVKETEGRERTCYVAPEAARIRGATVARAAHIRSVGHAAWPRRRRGRFEAPVPAAASARVRVPPASRAAVLVGL